MAKRVVRKANKSVRREQRKQVRREKQEQTIRNSVEIVLRTAAQQAAVNLIKENDITFLLGAAGSGKTFLAMAYAINAVLAKQVEKIVLTRPIVEAGEKLGFLPGSFGEKVNPYMQPLYDAMDTLLGKQGSAREVVNKSVVLAPLCYMRGRTFNDSICIFDEAQNAHYTQLKLFLTRFGHNSKIIVTGDPEQSDLYPEGYSGYVALRDVTSRLKDIKGIGFFEFAKSDVVRHPLVAEVLQRL
jgi:phosphate starvation-inducible PhoH-like protein